MDQDTSANVVLLKPVRPSGHFWLALALVVALLGWLVFFPSESYTTRSEVSEGASLAEGSKVAVEDYFEKYRAFPLNNRQAGVAEPTSINGTYVSSVTIANGTVSVAYGKQADASIAGRKLVFLPRPGGGTLHWSCNSAAGTTIEIKNRPTICRE